MIASEPCKGNACYPRETVATLRQLVIEASQYHANTLIGRTISLPFILTPPPSHYTVCEN